MSIGNYTRRQDNLFSYIPQEESFGAFLMWLIHYLNSSEGLASFRQIFFDNIILLHTDKGRKVKDVLPSYEQDDKVVVVSFKFADEETSRKAVLAIAEGTLEIATPKALERIRKLYTEGYNYIYFRMAYISSMEEQTLTKEEWNIVSCGLFNDTLSNLSELEHPIIKMFRDELVSRYNEDFNMMQEKIYSGQGRDVLEEPEAAKYIFDTFVENMFSGSANSKSERV